MDLIPTDWPLIVQALAWFAILCVAFATIGLLAGGAMWLGVWAEDRRYHVVLVDTPSGVLVFFTCAKCDRSANAWADQYDRPVCDACRTRTGRVTS